MSPEGESQDEVSPPNRAVGLSTALDRRHAWAQLFGDAPEPEPVHIAHFRIVRRLGAGGMGVVYEARDERLERRVAVKLLRGGELDDASAARLLREARAMAQVAHPNVVTVHEVGDHDGRTFIAMELVAGRTLRAWSTEGTRSIDEILAVFVQAARGLAAAHAAGLVHRDFKPENVLVGDDGRVRVLDFGLARTRGAGDPWLAAERVGRDPEAVDVRVTATGAIAGTPAYMAPEQWHEREPDHRADQYAWAVALWEALFGARPHAAASLGALAQVVYDVQPVVPDPDRAPAWLRVVLLRALAVEPAGRFGSMEAVIEAVERGPAGARGRGRVRMVGGSMAGAAVLAAATYLGWPTPTDACPSGMTTVPGSDTLPAYCLDRGEVTVAQWRACVDAGGCDSAPRTAYNDLESGERQQALLAEISRACTRDDQPDHPANCVTHLQAEQMCRWRDARLPTDDEWQWAAHGADKQWPYPWGTTAPDATVCISVDWRNPLLETCPVAPEKQHDRSPQSIVGLVGNVWEWTSTRSGPEAMDARIYRGGGFRNQYTGPWPEAADGSPRSFWGEATFKDPEVGFRCARSLP